MSQGENFGEHQDSRSRQREGSFKGQWQRVTVEVRGNPCKDDFVEAMGGYSGNRDY